MTTATAKPNLPGDMYVDNRVYTDPETYDREMARIFLNVWNFVCHESEIPAPGDFVTTMCAGQPIIVCRNREGKLRAFYNTCRHRAAQVVTEPCGNARVFTCLYHLWSYDLDGLLTGVPGAEAYQTSFSKSGLDRAAFGLVPVRVASQHRMVFVCFSDDTPELSDFLGEAADVLRVPFADPDLRVRVERVSHLRANWKMQPENSRDGYHAPLLHKRLRNVSPPRPYKLLQNGHALQHLGLDYEAGFREGTVDQFLVERPDLARDFLRYPLPGADLEAPSYILTLFPDFLIAFRFSTVLMERQIPVGPGETMFEFRSAGLVGDDDRARELRDAHWKLYWAEDGGNLPEDWEAWELQQKGVASVGVRYSLIARGERASEGLRGDDNRIRQFWGEWRRYMGATENGPVDGA